MNSENQENSISQDRLKTHTSEELQACLEVLLFLTDKPLSKGKLKEILEVPSNDPIQNTFFEETFKAFLSQYKNAHHGIECIEVAGGFQFRTKLERAALGKKLTKVQTQKLSPGAMESLAIIAYKQPVLKEEIDKIRGVDSSYFIRGLMEKKLIQIIGRSELPGKPILYATTEGFLQLFGLKDLHSLPSLRELEQMIPHSQTENPEEDPQIQELKNLVGQMNMNPTTEYDPAEDEKILNEIKQRVQSIQTSTPTLEAMLQTPVEFTNQNEEMS